MGDEIDYVNSDKGCETLGMMIFSNDLVELYGRDTGQTILRLYKKVTSAEISINTFCNDLTEQ